MTKQFVDTIMKSINSKSNQAKTYSNFKKRNKSVIDQETMKCMMANFAETPVPGMFSLGKSGVDSHNVSNFKTRKGSVTNKKKKAGPFKVDHSFNKNLSLNIIKNEKSGRDSNNLNLSMYNDVSPNSNTLGGRKKSGKKRPESAVGGTVRKVSKTTRAGSRKSSERKSSMEAQRPLSNYSNLLGHQM